MWESRAPNLDDADTEEKLVPDQNAWSASYQRVHGSAGISSVFLACPFAPLSHW